MMVDDRGVVRPADPREGPVMSPAGVLVQMVAGALALAAGVGALVSFGVSKALHSIIGVGAPLEENIAPAATLLGAGAALAVAAVLLALVGMSRGRHRRESMQSFEA